MRGSGAEISIENWESALDRNLGEGLFAEADFIGERFE